MAAATSTRPTARHDISLCGLTGLIFAILTTALVLFLEGFVTTSWAIKDNIHQGLWHACERKDSNLPATEWFKVVKVFACLSLISIVFSFLLITYYMKSLVCKNFILITLTVFSFISAANMLVTVGVFGSHGLDDKRSSWSYWVVVVAAILSLLAAVLCVAQIRRSNVRACLGTSEE